MATPNLRYGAGRGHFGNADWCGCFFVIISASASTARRPWGGVGAVQLVALWSGSRITRLYPLFLIGLALAVVAWSQGLDFAVDEVNAKPWRQLGASLFNLRFTTPFPAFGPSWSLSCEVLYTRRGQHCCFCRRAGRTPPRDG